MFNFFIIEKNEKESNSSDEEVKMKIYKQI
jgi:hypothetical protein